MTTLSRDYWRTKRLRTSLFALAPDGVKFLNVLKTLAKVEEDDSHSLEGINVSAEHIQARLEEALARPNHFEKVQWFSRYWNDAFIDKSYVKKIVGWGI